MSEAAAVEHRRAVGSLSRVTERQFRTVWRSVAGPDAAVVRDALMDTVPVLAETYGNMAGALASDYYDELRDQAAVRGRFRAQPAALPGTARYEALVRWGVDPLFTGTPDQVLALSRLSGGLQRIVADVARETVANAAIRDPQAQGWRRVARGDGCSFCRMLADRGAVYTDSSVTFKSHDNCNCSASPEFGRGRTVSTVQYQASKRNVSAADRARVREYLRDNY